MKKQRIIYLLVLLFISINNLFANHEFIDKRETVSNNFFLYSVLSILLIISIIYSIFFYIKLKEKILECILD